MYRQVSLVISANVPLGTASYPFHVARAIYMVGAAPYDVSYKLVVLGRAPSLFESET